MARPPSATAALLLLLVLSLLAVAHCRTVAVVAADHAAEPESTAAGAVAVSDENGLSNPTLPAEAGASATEEEVLPAEQQQHGLEFLRLPSHRHHRHRPCSLHHHLWWKRHHGVYRDAPLRFPMAEEVREAEEVKPVAEPDPDRSLPDSDGDGELVASKEPSFADADGHEEDGEHAAAVRAWKKEMLRRWFHFHFHHGMRRHRLHHHHHDEEEGPDEAAPEGMSMKRFHFHHHDEEDNDEEKNMVKKRLRNAEHGEDSDDEDEDEQVEEMVRRFRKAIMRRRRFGHGHGHGHGHRDHSHRHAEDAEKQADGEEESGVLAWIKALMNRF
jgi:hypothetical protein